MFVYENYPLDTTELSAEHELTLTDISIHESTHYPLALVAAPGPQLGLRAEYDTTVFDTHTIDTLLQRLQRILHAMTTQPTRRLSSIDVLDEGERARLERWGNRAVLTQPAPSSTSIPALFAAQVARAPQAAGDQLRGTVVDLS